MKTLLILPILITLGVNSHAQERVKTFIEKSSEIEKKSMTVLTSWASLNIISGSIGWATTDNESKYFNQMNVAWNVVNLGIALPSMIKKHTTNLSNHEVLTRQHKIEKILLLNIGLDAAYITGGFLLKEMSKNNPDNFHRYQGFGNSLILQGGFLLAFDVIQFIIHQKHRKRGSPNLSSGLSLSDEGIGLSYHF